MNSIKSLKTLVQKLTTEEYKSLLKYLNYNNDLNKNELKSIQLVKLLMDKKSYSISEIQIRIYGKINYEAFSKLLNRLKLKIYEVLAFDSNISQSQYSNRNKMLLMLRKKILQADILQLKGMRNDVIPIYNFIISKSKIFELYEIQIQALNSKLRLQSINTKSASFKIINNEIKNAEICFDALKNSNNIYREISNLISNSINFISYRKDLVMAIDNLKFYHSVSNSATIGFYYNTLSAEMYQNSLDYKSAQKCLEQAQDILLTNESAYTENRYGNNLLNLSNNNIYLYNFELAIKIGDKSRTYFKNLPFTLKIVDEILFYSYFYNKEFDKCFSLINNMNSNSDNEMVVFKFNYFQACLFFISKEFQKSIINLLEYNEVDKDKEGWNINRRILLIMSRIELEDFESVDLQIQSLERFIKRMSKSKTIKLRYKVILRILIKLVQENYNFTSVYISKIKYFNLLESMDNSEYKWEIKSPELIIFNDWFKSKFSNVQMNQTILNYKMDLVNQNIKI